MTGFQTEYENALRNHMREADERTLRMAYEFGRDAVGQGLGILELIVVHHDALVGVLSDDAAATDVGRSVDAAGEFLLEAFSALEMVQRGYHEAREVARRERRHAELVRSLSAFLSDASLAGGAPESVGEVLSLVAEQARELIPADCCLVTAGSEAQVHVAASAAPESTRWDRFVRWADLSEIDALVRAHDGVTALPADRILEKLRAASGASAVPAELRNWLAAPLAALNGQRIGAIHLVNKEGGGFTDLDEAVLQHVAQMSAAALDRARLYGASLEP